MSPKTAALHPIEASRLHARRERVFLILAGIFLGSMAMLNILGITKFIDLGTVPLGPVSLPLELAVGVLPYPLTFLCTDFISELYGRARANFVVFTGLIINLIVLGFISLGDAVPPIDFRTPAQRIVTMDYVDGVDAEGNPIVDPATDFTLARPAVPELDADGAVVIDPDTGKPRLRPVEQFALAPVPGGPPDALRLVDADTGQPIVREEALFSRIATTTRQAILASMIAYLFAQFVDVYLFHFWKKLTRGRMLWLRNNGSTLVSQLVDTSCVVLITFWVQIRSGDMPIGTVLLLIKGGYLFKMTVALVDTIPFYFGVGILSRYLRIDPSQEHAADAEGIALDNPPPDPSGDSSGGSSGSPPAN
ncbi:MAG: queuosine precursor transporter [Phycisphaerales bacterium]